MFEFLKKKDTNNDENTYTYEDYKQNIKKIQELELNSNKFKNICEFIENYYTRKSIEKEQILLSMLQSNYNYNNQFYIKKLKKIKKLINCLDEEELNSNIYLSAIKQGLDISKEDCKKIKEQLLSKYEELEFSSEYQYIIINKNIDNKSLKLLGDFVETKTYVKHFDENEEYDLVNILDEQNIKYYEIYNEIIASLSKIYKSIFYYNLIKEISNTDIDVSEICLEFDEEKFNEVSVYFLVKKEKEKKKHKKK